MLVNINKTKFHVDFQYFRDNTRKPIETVCRISSELRKKKINNKPSTKLEAIGLRKLGSTDQPIKRVGRKIALTRALSSLNLTKEQRKLFWEIYLTNKNNLG